MTDQGQTTSALDLQLAPSEHLRIDGVTYDIAPMSGLGIAASARLTRHYTRAVELEQLGENATEDDEREYLDRLRAITAAAIPDAPPEVVEKLNLAQLKAVTLDFFARGASTPEGAAIQKSMARIVKRSRISSLISQESTAPANGS